MSPVDSITCHKLVYIITNTEKNLPTKILMVPYLHEKRVYLNRYKKNTEYFYTSIDLGNCNSLNSLDLKYYDHEKKSHEEIE